MSAMDQLVELVNKNTEAIGDNTNTIGDIVARLDVLDPDVVDDTSDVLPAAPVAAPDKSFDEDATAIDDGGDNADDANGSDTG